MEYSPVPLVLVTVATEDAVLVAVTVAPDTIAPLGSVIVPRIVPVTVWAIPCRTDRQRESRIMGNPKRFIKGPLFLTYGCKESRQRQNSFAA
jgi:hypothetical protein